MLPFVLFGTSTTAMSNVFHGDAESNTPVFVLSMNIWSAQNLQACFSAIGVRWAEPQHFSSRNLSRFNFFVEWVQRNSDRTVAVTVCNTRPRLAKDSGKSWTSEGRETDPPIQTRFKTLASSTRETYLPP